MTDVALPVPSSNTGTNDWADVYDNDSAIATFLNSTGVHVYQAGTVNATALASGSVTTAKLASASFQAKRASFGAIGAALGTNVTVTWDSAFADTNYTVSIGLEQSAAAPTANLTAAITAKATTGLTVRVFNGSDGNQSGTVHAVAFHD